MMTTKKIGLAIFTIIALGGLLAPWLAPFNPSAHDLAHKLEAPSSIHLLGTDGNGSDVLSQLLYGARLSLTVAFLVVAISSILGLIFGALAGYFGGIVDLAFLRTIEVLYAFPGFLLALTIIAFLGSSLSNVVIALCITGWTSYARVVRAEVMKLRQEDFVIAAKAVGASPARVIFRHIVPHVFPVLRVQMVFGAAAAVISEAGLSFLGLGTPSDMSSWGSLLMMGRSYIFEAPHICLFASLIIMAFVMALTLMGRQTSANST